MWRLPMQADFTPSPSAAEPFRKVGMSAVGRVKVLRLDVELGDGLDPRTLRSLADRAQADVVELERGAVALPSDPTAFSGWLGLLVLEGLVVRHVQVGVTGWTELLGRGDIVRSWTRDRELGASFPTSGRYEVIEPLRLALLDEAFARQVAPFPQVASALIGRAVERSRWLTYLLASAQPARIEERVWMVLWHLADRWGRVTPLGVELSLAHRALAVMLGARRPTVTMAVRRLAERGLLTHDARGRWVLHGEPAAEIASLSRAAEPAHELPVGD